MPSTLKIAHRKAMVARKLGEIKKELFDRAVGQAKRPNSGTVARSTGLRKPQRTYSRRQRRSTGHFDTGKAFGAPASRLVLQHLSPWIVEPQTIHRGVVGALGVDAAAIQFRDEKLVLVQKKEPK